MIFIFKFANTSIIILTPNRKIKVPNLKALCAICEVIARLLGTSRTVSINKFIV